MTHERLDPLAGPTCPGCSHIGRRVGEDQFRCIKPGCRVSSYSAHADDHITMLLPNPRDQPGAAK